MLDIVLRTCDHTDVHPERGPRFIDVDKTTLIKKCFISLLDAIDQAKDICEIDLWILDDHSETSWLDYMNENTKQRNIKCDIIALSTKGYNNSALLQFEYCKNIGRKWVYSVEDDYLHFPQAIRNMLIMGERFKQLTGMPVAIKPDDDPFTYASNTESSKKPCILLLGNDRYWRTACNTHNTIFTEVSVIKDYWELFASLAKYFRKLPVNEDNTINMLWNDGARSQGPVSLFSPIPSLAMHISQGNEPPFLNYKSLWESIKI
jgi:hypothetical protein